MVRGGVAVVALATLVVGLSSADVASRRTHPEAGPRAPVGAAGVRLVAYDSCATALRGFRRAALPKVGPYGLHGLYGGGVVLDAIAAEGTQSRGPAVATNMAPQDPGYSGTNVHEAGVDEPDLVKTDGRRIVTLNGNRLRVIDVRSREITASLKLPGNGYASQLLLHGDRALVFTTSGWHGHFSDGPGPARRGYESKLVLVDLVGGARVIGTLDVDGSYVDARATGPAARVVLRSAPRLDFTYPARHRGERAAERANRGVVTRSSISDWLPRYMLRQNGKRTSGQLVNCADLSRPEGDQGVSTLTVLTLDLRDRLGTGDPISVIGDGGTVYGTGDNLYIAGADLPDAAPSPSKTSSAAVPERLDTKIFQFDTSGPGRPEFVASGAVKGGLLNQYSLSEHAGNLRIATTEGQPWGRRQNSSSRITVLTRRGDELVELGHVGGLGKSEEIYAVRFLGDVGYVVTFRQTDPLYAVDLSDPRRPKVTGELKIRGYSAYLHPAGQDRLIGVGQDATRQGSRTGLQVSLFDTGDSAAPRRVATYGVRGAFSDVEHDPHAFLYWPDRGLIVLPMWSEFGERSRNGALVLRITGDRLHKIGMLSHPGDDDRYANGEVRRTLVIADELWTISEAGVLASDLTTLRELAWVPFR